MAIDTDILKQLEALNKSFGQLSNVMTQAARASGVRVDGRNALRGEFDSSKPTRLEKAAEKKAEKFDTVAGQFLKATGGLTSDVKKSRDSFKAMQEAWKSVGGALSGIDENFRTYGTSIGVIGQQAKRLVDGMSRFTSTLAKSTKAQSLLYAKQIENISGFKDFEIAGYYDKLTEALDNLDEGSKRAFNVIDEVTGKMRTDLDLEDFSKIRSALGEMLANVNENLSATEFKNLGDMFKAGTDIFTAAGDAGTANRAALVKIAAELEARGIYKPSSANLSALENGELKGASAQNDLFTHNNAKEFVSAIKKAVDSLEMGAKKIDKTVDDFTIPLRRFGATIASVEGRTAALKKAFDYFLTTAALKKGADGLKRLYEEVTSFNVAQIPASFMQVQAASVQLGMDFKETSAILAENKRILAIYGPTQFRDSLTMMKGTFAKFGYSMKQGAELIGPSVEAAIASGINVRDPNQLNKFTDSMMSSFQKISGIVNVSAKEFIQLNGQLFKSEGTFETLMGMDVERRQQYAQELVQLRERYIVNGLDLQQAQKLVEIQQQQQRDKVQSRLGDAAKVMALGQASGLGGAQSMELFNLSRKGIRNKDEDARLTALLGNLNQGVEQARVAGYGSTGMGAGGYAVDVLRENLMPGGALGEMMKSGLQMNAASQTGAQVTKAEQERAAALVKGNESVAKFGNTINSVSAVMSSALMAATVGTAVSMAALIIQTRGLTAAFGGLLGKMGLPGGAGGAPGGAGGGAGGAGKWGGKLAKIGGGLGIGTILGIGGSLAGDALTSSGHEKAGATASILGSAAGWGATGAAIGSAFPVVGTVAGGIAGSVLGAGAGIYQNWGAFSGPSAPKIVTPEAIPDAINTPAIGTGLIAVKDASATEQLMTIANLSNQMVQLLQKLTDTDPSKTSSVAKQISQPVPSAYTYYTGKLPRTSS
jgi:hypothetical protein